MSSTATGDLFAGSPDYVQLDPASPMQLVEAQHTKQAM